MRSLGLGITFLQVPLVHEWFGVTKIKCMTGTELREGKSAWSDISSLAAPAEREAKASKVLPILPTPAVSGFESFVVAGSGFGFMWLLP